MQWPSWTNLRFAGRPCTVDTPVMGKTYQVGIVGEASYQGPIGRCFEGQRVHILHEPDNPYDPEALVVVTEAGATIGYIARDCWLQDAIHEEGRGCGASIKEITSAGAGGRGVVIDVALRGRGVGTRNFSRAPAAPPVESKGWLSRLLGF
jgi:hypothetical protein